MWRLPTRHENERCQLSGIQHQVVKLRVEAANVFKRVREDKETLAIKCEQSTTIQERNSYQAQEQGKVGGDLSP